MSSPKVKKEPKNVSSLRGGLQTLCVDSMDVRVQLREMRERVPFLSQKENLLSALIAQTEAIDSIIQTAENILRCYQDLTD